MRQIEAVLHRLVGEHPIVPFGVDDDLVVIGAGVLRQNPVELLPHLHDELGLDLRLIGPVPAYSFLEERSGDAISS